MYLPPTGPVGTPAACFVVLVAIAVASCSADGASSGDGVPIPVDSPPAASSDANVVGTPMATISTTLAPATTRAPTTTLSPAEAYVSEVCAVFSEAGFETRRALLGEVPGAFAEANGDAEGDARATLAAQCAPSLERLQAAAAIRDRLDAIESDEETSPAVEVTSFSCGSGNITVDVTNLTDVSLGIHGSFAIYRSADRADPIQSSYAPNVIWSLAPGATATIAGLYADVGGDDLYCTYNGDVFDADTSDVDASLGVATHPELTGDDPSIWLPELIRIERAAIGTGDADLAAVIADIRSVGYDDVLDRIVETVETDSDPDSKLDPDTDSELVSGPAAAPASEIDKDSVAEPEIGAIEVCERGLTQPDPDRISLVYREVWNGGSRMRHGLFRRGLDGQWRWLSTAQYFESSIVDDCAFVDFHPGEFVGDSAVPTE